MVALATHTHTTEQHERATELWRRILDTHVTSIYEERRDYQSYLETVTDDHLSALISSNGQETDDYYPVTITLASYSDYGGSDLDAANVRYLRETETPGVHFGSGAHGTEYAWVQLGELPTNGDDIDTGIDWLQSLAALIDTIAEYGLISDESHSAYVDELAEEAWDQWLGDIVSTALWELSDGNPDDFQFTDDEIRELYYGYEDNWWMCETATSVRNENHDDALAHVCDSIVSAWRTSVVDANQLALY
ncbi:MAG TPA: hypothetical protein VFW65_12470 [Pseudonocardiaceae bacterium]|nr:hypothetical protein [Pseudonocardiaceae bacterium]